MRSTWWRGRRRRAGSRCSAITTTGRATGSARRAWAGCARAGPRLAAITVLEKTAASDIGGTPREISFQDTGGTPELDPAAPPTANGAALDPYAQNPGLN